MYCELRNGRLHLYPTTIAEFSAAHLWVEVAMPIQAFVHRPLDAIQEYKLLQNNQIIESTNDENKTDA